MEALEKIVCPNGQSKGLVTQLTAELKSCPDSSVDIVFSIKWFQLLDMHVHLKCTLTLCMTHCLIVFIPTFGSSGKNINIWSVT